jgi:hypothetical protein
VKTMPDSSPQPRSERSRWTPPTLQLLPRLTRLTLTTFSAGQGDDPGLFSFRSRGSDLG